MYNKYKYAVHPGIGARARTLGQHGVAAIEFAFIFPIFFLMLYGIITYGMIFLAQQSMTLAAEEGARAALRYTVVDADRGTAACATVTPLVSWLVHVDTCTPPAPMPCAASSSARCITVKVTYPYTTHPLVPSLPGMGIALPTTLGSSATVQID
ncbi:TadE-like protein [Collimonas sp. OK607]|uniref:TadE/TadG family type IV pilus assembly protein n=1 Tax=Collimonas sp. OK607 TaxID=1798194 RepID=UPI0008E967ED|nr:TadE/TadG family type IV pilus assembly protein [Collimonas sp. OK607]SFA80639.1 TadE-like protein [Collimonas sp. OK607]